MTRELEVGKDSLKKSEMQMLLDAHPAVELALPSVRPGTVSRGAVEDGVAQRHGCGCPQPPHVVQTPEVEPVAEVERQPLDRERIEGEQPRYQHALVEHGRRPPRQVSICEVLIDEAAVRKHKIAANPEHVLTSRPRKAGFRRGKLEIEVVRAGVVLELRQRQVSGRQHHRIASVLDPCDRYDGETVVGVGGGEPKAVQHARRSLVEDVGHRYAQNQLRRREQTFPEVTGAGRLDQVVPPERALNDDAQRPGPVQVAGLTGGADHQSKCIRRRAILSRIRPRRVDTRQITTTYGRFM